MKNNPTACAGNQGTTITIEDLFYNVPIRQKTIKSPTDEFSKIFDVVSKYSVHNHSVSFTLKKHGENNSIKTQISSTSIDPIRVIYGNEVANSLLKVCASDENLKFKMKGYVSKADYSGKKGQFLLFINHRLVESKSLKKALFDDLYRSVLTNSVQPFIYMSLEIDPGNVDVNVSPTKNEVSFLNEDLIVENIREVVEDVLLKTNEVRKVYTQQLLPGATLITFEEPKEKLYAKDLIRTDSKEQSIIKFLNQSTDNETSQIIDSSLNGSKSNNNFIMPSELSSIREILGEIEAKCDDNLKEQIRSLKFVGNASHTKTIIQCENILYICDNRKLAHELFFQMAIINFSHFDAIEFEEPLKVEELSLIGLDMKECSWTEEDGPKEILAKQVEKLLVEQREMLKEYFSITINSNGELETLPVFINGYSPLSAYLPLFFIRLASEVNFEDEKECFKNISTELAKFYSRWSLTTEEEEHSHLMQNIIFPEIQKTLLPPKEFLNDGTFLKLTSLQELYKVFERC